MAVNDAGLEMLKAHFEKFSTLEDFKKDFRETYGTDPNSGLVQAFNSAKGSDDDWMIYKYYTSSETVRMSTILPTEEVTVEKIIEVLNSKNLNEYKRVTLKLENKDYPGIERLKDFGIDFYIEIVGDAGFCTIDEFIKMREFFDTFKETYHPDNLSPLEKITLAYDHTKFFQYNEEETDSKVDSRSLAKIISNGNVVCLGYSRIFCELLREMGIKANIMDVYQDNYDEDGHARVMVSINDEKYNVNGLFLFDPTFDASQDMALVENEDGETSYKIGKAITPEDKVVETYPSSILYNCFMIPVSEYRKYFPDEKTKGFTTYPGSKEIKFSEEIMNTFMVDDLQPKDPSVMNVLPEVLTVTKKIEGYTPEQTEEYIQNAVDLMVAYRFGSLDKNASVNM